MLIVHTEETIAALVEELVSELPSCHQDYCFSYLLKQSHKRSVARFRKTWKLTPRVMELVIEESMTGLKRALKRRGITSLADLEM
jgi:hypothetical protein